MPIEHISTKATQNTPPPCQKAWSVLDQAWGRRTCNKRIGIDMERGLWSIFFHLCASEIRGVAAWTSATSWGCSLGFRGTCGPRSLRAPAEIASPPRPAKVAIVRASLGTEGSGPQSPVGQHSRACSGMSTGIQRTSGKCFRHSKGLWAIWVGSQLEKANATLLKRNLSFARLPGISEWQFPTLITPSRAHHALKGVSWQLFPFGLLFLVQCAQKGHAPILTLQISC